MKNTTFEYIRNMIRNHMNEEAVAPTNNASSDAVKVDLPPVDLRKRRYKKLPGPYKDLFRRKRNV